MGKMTRGEFISRLEKLNKDTDWDKAYKFFERQSGTRVETNKEVLRNSWVFDVAWHVYHGVGTTKEIKSTTQKIRNYVRKKFTNTHEDTLYPSWGRLPRNRMGV